MSPTNSPTSPVPTPTSAPPTTPAASAPATIRPSQSTVPIPLGGAADSRADGRRDVNLPSATADPPPTQSQTPSPSPTCDPSPSPSPTPTCPPSSPIEDPNDEPIDSPADDDFGASSAQDDLYFVGARVLTIVEDHLDLYPGYGGLVADVPTRTLRLYWRQTVPLPAEIMEIVTAPGRPVIVELLDAPFGRLSLNEARDVLVANADSLDAQLCGFLHTFVVPQNASAVVVRIEPDYELTDPTTYINTAQSILTALAGYPVRVELAPAFEATGRRDDRSPWYAGAAIKEVRKDGGCSSGFGVVKNDLSWLLTAAHCFANGARVETVDGQEIGTVSDLKELLDTELISANEVRGKTYVKGVDSYDALPITEPGLNMAGLFVCTSGAATGMNCYLKIVDIDATVRKKLRPWKVVAEAQVLADAIKTRNDGRKEIPAVAVGGGDSGGPVFLVSLDPTDSKHLAAGIISAGEAANNILQDHKVPCNKGHKGDGRCYSRVAYTAIKPILKEYGVTLAP
ncbi:MAG TPA: hypothetical protein VFC19_17265 [Candidatus Limnocylindrales bacterium]|nr:hypothetical protein [Candidatus Limnocylindrales bacterium]